MHLLLADDDDDDCMFFKEALEELPLDTNLTVVNDGEQLMNLLLKEGKYLPDVLFLDLNMPRKNGFDCLTEIKQNENFNTLPVIIFSTSFNPEVVDMLYSRGANYYIRKPAYFSDLKKIISQALDLILDNNNRHPEKEKFVLYSI